jgi:hypothetical protein
VSVFPCSPVRSGAVLSRWLPLCPLFPGWSSASWVAGRSGLVVVLRFGSGSWACAVAAGLRAFFPGVAVAVRGGRVFVRAVFAC